MSSSIDENKMVTMMTFSHMPAVFAGAKDMKEAKGTFRGLEVLNVMGYFPLVSTITGLARIIFVLTSKVFNPKNEHGQSAEFNAKKMREKQILRGLIEMTSLAGLILHITDIVNTVGFFNMVMNEK